MTDKISYNSYLKVNTLLDLQSPESQKKGKEAHDEMLFIIIHQTYELWFKQILHELNSVLSMFKGNYVQEKNLGTVISRFDRIIEIQKVLVSQITILETMTPMDFLEFRDLLTPSSGFQSAQFRLIENKLGMTYKDRIQYGKKRYNKFLNTKESDLVLNSENEPSLFTLLEMWLERTPFLQMDDFDFWTSYKKSVDIMINNDLKHIKSNIELDEQTMKNSLNQYKSIKHTYNALFDEQKYIKLQNDGYRRLSQKATLGALFIQLYRDEPVLQLPHKLLTQLVNIDHLFTSWRNRHRLLVYRMIGVKIGTGGSSGHSYLKKTSDKHSIFSDIANLSTYIIPRSLLPELPTTIKQQLGFFFTYGK
ncbi:MAG: tryptophan 2,3-dioxygenase [Candidatus Marinimicrobia bacterium]|nr:tryptophan 2,3-dioxygenase [Candidatus Neomarinimicrobiota bacterium]|tara:strand:+ start:1095 stop:2183 length:1089 start_codon:yes stop_codon:yes gene_type:complete